MASQSQDPAGRPTRPSMYDVAREAGVALGTVSNVLNKPGMVATRTRQRVEHAMAKLGYVPNAVARSLARGTASTIGLIVGDLTNSLFVDITRGAERSAESAGLTLMLANADSRLDRQLAYLSVFAQARVTGILMTLNDRDHLGIITEHAPAGLPLVMLDCAAPDDVLCSVSVDNELGGYLAGRHLLERGRRRLLFVGGPEQLDPITARARGFRRAVAQAGEVVAREVTGEWVDRVDGREVGAAVLPRLRRGEFDGVFAATDMLAAGFIEAVTAGGVSVPDDVAVVGYDNNKAAWDSPVPISTIAQPGEEIGTIGAQLIQDEAAALRDGTAAEHRHRTEIVAPSLIVRRSSV